MTHFFVFRVYVWQIVAVFLLFNTLMQKASVAPIVNG